MGHSAHKFDPQPNLQLYDSANDTDLDGLYGRFFEKTGSPEAAATLVLAAVQASQVAVSPVQKCDNLHVGTAEFLTVKQAAKKYNLGERTIYRMVEDGLPVTRAGRAIRIRPRDLAKRLADSETILR